MAVPSRVRWRCRRGTRELDRLLEDFADQCYAGLTPTEQAAFERLLEAEDDLLIDWILTGREQPGDEQLAATVAAIRHTADL